MHWATISSMLACAVASAYLVFVEGWDSDTTLFIVAGCGIAASVTLLGVLWLICDPAEHPEFQRMVRTIAIAEFNGFLRVLRLKR